jgi:DNA-binding transcriptional regulator GbsR (MarR family)
MTTDTPRTDAEVFELQDCNGQLRKVITTQFAKQLERELAASKVEVARLQKELDATCNAEELRQERETRKRAEAEVDRLRGLLNDHAEFLIARVRAEVQRAIEDRTRFGIEIRGEYLPKLKKSENEVERLAGRMKEAEDLIKGLHDGWKKARKAHLETCKNAQTEIDKLHAENVCLQEIIQELYEWTRRDYPTEQEVREIMNRYHDLLNK